MILHRALFVGCALAASLIGGCSAPRLVLPDPSGAYGPVKGMKVPPGQALELARPYLDRSFELRRQGRPPSDLDHRRPSDVVVVEGEWYYISRDNHADSSPKFFLPHAVRVSGLTGEVVPPQ